MKTFELKGSVRADLGKKASKAERVSENVPCVLYGGANNVHFTATASDLRKLIYSPDVFVVQLDIDGQKCNSIMKALQFHPVTDKVLHIDFLQYAAVVLSLLLVGLWALVMKKTLAGAYSGQLFFSPCLVALQQKMQ